jgi:four helix bundle protein
VAAIRRYEDLIAWQKAFALVLRVYEASKGFPADERFGLTQQVRRAFLSIPSNIAEGWGRFSRTDYLRFLDMARGSTFELQTQLKLADALGFLGSHGDIHELVGEVERLVSALIRALRNKQNV